MTIRYLIFYHITYITYYISIMSRNTFGGNKTKSFARKLNDDSSSSVLRLPEDTLEVISQVTKILGQGRIIVNTNLSHIPQMQSMIRNKFRGRSKRNHLIQVGSVILIGLHHWEEPNYKHSDVIHIYSPSDVTQLLHRKLIPSSFASADMDLTSDTFMFSSEATDDIFDEKEPTILPQKIPQSYDGGSMCEDDDYGKKMSAGEIDFDLI